MHDRLPLVDLVAAAKAYEAADDAAFAEIASELGIELTRPALAQYLARFQTELHRDVLDLVYQSLFLRIGYALGGRAGKTVLVVRANDRLVVGIQRALSQEPFPKRGWAIGRWYKDPTRNRPTVDAWAADPARATDALSIPIVRPPRGIDDERGESLLAAVCANPDDEAARLVYADWLSEHGDARGELIRLQCELEKPIVDQSRYFEMKARESVLLATLRNAMCAPIDSFAQYARLRRGLVERVHMEVGQLAKHGEHLVATQPITELRIAVTSPDDYARLEKLDFVGRIPHLAIDAGKFDPISLATSPLLARTRTLELSDVEKGMEVWRFVQTARLPALERLVLSRVVVRTETLVELANPHVLPRLRALVLAPPHDSYSEQAVFAAIPNALAQLAPRSFVELTLELWEMTDHRLAQCLAAILACETLASLAIDNLSIGTESVRAIESPRLERLRLDGVRVPAVTELVTARRLPALQRLDLEIFSNSPGTTEEDDDYESPPTDEERRAFVAALLAHPISEVRISNLALTADELAALRQRMIVIA